MKQNPAQTTASFEMNLCRHIGKHKSTAFRDVRVWFEIFIGKVSFVLFAVCVAMINGSSEVFLLWM
jgi:hypothetical protein